MEIDKIDNDRYRIYDYPLRAKSGEVRYTASQTILKPYKETRGHSHIETDEVYIFTDGVGEMIIGDRQFPVFKDLPIYIPKGEFHQVRNMSGEPLAFWAIFQGTPRRPTKEIDKKA